MAIRQFTFSPRLTRQFVRFGYDLYQGDPHWIAPFEDELWAQLARRFYFYQDRANRHAHFLACSGTQVVGRISALFNHNLRDRNGQAVGMIGFFESVDDYAVAKDLFDAASGWLGENLAIDRIWGPMNFDIWHGYRLKSAGFERSPFYGEPYNKHYYAEFFERYGFTAKQQWRSFEISGVEALRQLAHPAAELHGALVKQGYRFVSFSRLSFRTVLKNLHRLLEQTFNGFLGYTPLSDAEFERLFMPMRYVAQPRLFLFADAPDGQCCGFAAGLPEVSAAVRAMGGQTDWYSRARFLYHSRAADRLNFYLIGTTPEHQREGLGKGLFSLVLQSALNSGYRSALLSLVADGNPSCRLLRGSNVDNSRQYTLYELNR
jgi:GNAT superfamily N-acetyltransferase